MIQKPKMLFIGHVYHLKTKSSRFITEMLETRYEIDYFYFDPASDNNSAYDSLSKKSYDVLVIWQVMPSLVQLRKKIKFKKSVYFPMYDQYVGLGGFLNHRWAEYQQTQLICFSRKMADELTSAGLSTHYIQYFPKPISVDSWGDVHKVFFWQRTEDITIDKVLTLLQNEDIQSIHMHKVVDFGHRFFIPPEKWLDKTTYSIWFDTKEEMRTCIETAAFFIAPRLYEGIGMTMLEAMACGRCVIAPDLSTANEYIVHGKTGYLYHPGNPEPLDIKDVRQIQQNAYDYICVGYQQWEREKMRIFDWIDEPVQFNAKLYNEKMTSVIKKRYQTTRIPGIRYRKSKNKTSFYLGRFPIWRIKENKKQTRVKHLLFGLIPVMIIRKKRVVICK